MKVLGIIPARSGSKRIPEKNIQPVLGKPLIWYIIQSAKKAKTLIKLIVSTDSEKIAQIARDSGVQVPFLRPKNLAQDNTPDLPVFLHALEKLEENGEKFDIVVNLRPTSPLLESEDIDKAVSLLIKTGADSVRSMQPATQPPQWMKTVDKNGFARPFLANTDERKFPTRASLPEKVYQLNAQIDVMKVYWIKKGNLYGEKMAAYIMDPQNCIDIDNLTDVYAAEAILVKRRRQ